MSDGHENVLHLDSIALRALAEYASSLRGPGGNPSFLVSGADDSGRAYDVTPFAEFSPCSDAAHVVVPCNTATVQPDRAPVQQVSIQALGMAEPESLARYDALFWSEAAVEKFLFPYYASKYQWAAAEVLSVIARVFYGYVPGVLRPAASELDTGATVPFAMAHLPRSDYTPVEEPQPELGSELAFLFLDRATGKVTHRMLSEYLRPPAG